VCEREDFGATNWLLGFYQYIVVGLTMYRSSKVHCSHVKSARRVNIVHGDEDAV
jgi:hypothetical protein